MKSERQELHKMGRVARIMYRLVAAFARFLCVILWRLEVSGKENLPKDGPFIVAPVHRSYVDFLIVGVSVGRVSRYLAKNSLWKYGIPGRILTFGGAIPVERNKLDRNALRLASAAIETGDPLVVFPEGERRDGPIVTEIFDGPAWLAARHRVPIVPVGIAGSDRVMPRGAKFIRRGKIKVIIGEPLLPDVPETGRPPRAAITQLTGETQSAIQRLYDEAQEVSA